MTPDVFKRWVANKVASLTKYFSVRDQTESSNEETKTKEHEKSKKILK